MLDRRLVLGIAVAFLVLMAVLYSWALRPPPVPEVEEPAVQATPAPTTPASRRSSSRSHTPTRRSYPPPAAPTVVEEALPDPDAAQITGTVLDDRRRPVASVSVRYRSGKRRKKVTTDSKGRFEIEASGAEIEVWAERKDGALIARSETVTIDGSSGGEWEVDLVLESAKKAGLGIRVSRHDDGVFVRGVLDGSPAQKLGLVKGDIIVEVDGQDVAGMAVSTITSKLTGPVGTTQLFSVRHLDGTVEEYEFERVPIAATN